MASDNKIRVKRSSIPGKNPNITDLDLGEIAINTHDGQMFIKKDQNGNESVVTVGEGSESTNRVYYVATTGNDSLNSGKSVGAAFATLSRAVSQIETDSNDFFSENPNGVFRSTIYLKTGDYTVANPIRLPPRTTIIGDNLRSVSIFPQDTISDILYVTNGNYIANVTFRSHGSPAAAVAFDPNPTTIPEVTASPYVQNCSCITGTGIGMKIDGSVVSGNKSMVADGFTQYNEGGIGVYLLNRGYAQLVSIFTIACDKGIYAESGGQCSLTNSNCSFGNYGLVSTGASEVISSGTISGSYTEGDDQIDVTSSISPKYGEAILISGYPNYYTVEDVEEIGTDQYRLKFLEGLFEPISDGSSVEFLRRSLIAASSITFEYVGAGINLPDALPQNGGIPIQENEVLQDDNDAGQVYFTSTDQKGDFRIGGELSINRNEGTITGLAFNRSLFNVLTPYILALE